MDLAINEEMLESIDKAVEECVRRHMEEMRASEMGPDSSWRRGWESALEEIEVRFGLEASGE